MQDKSARRHVVREHAEPENPLWAITVMMAIFFAVAALLIAIG
ncbi:MAG: hypothetical protein ACT4UP_00085 [Gammaproteobacteria bacterium]